MSPLGKSDDSALTWTFRLFVDLVEDSLAEVTYDATLAGLSYGVSNHDEGISVSVGGYNDKLDVLLRLVLEKIRVLSVQPDRLRVVKEKVRNLVFMHSQRTV